LDNFNRANSTSLGANWNTPTTGYRINSNTLQVLSGTYLLTWSTAFGPNQEVYFTFNELSAVADEQDLILKANATNTSMIEVLYDHSASQVHIYTLDPTNGWVNHATINGVSFAAADQFGAAAAPDGTVTVYKNGMPIGSTNVTSGPNPWPMALAQAGGKIGMWFVGASNTGAGDARVDDFGGGTIP
jgi:hypothetical protein